METLSDSILDRAVIGVNLAPSTLRDQLGEAPTLLVFLRHFGCIFCRETISDIRAASESQANFPDVLFFTQAEPTETKAFLRRYWPTARAISDPELVLYDALGVGRASFLQALGPAVLRARSRAVAKGHRNGPRSGDIWRLPGAMVVQEAQVIWRYEPTHAADHPDFAAIPTELRATG